MYGKGEFGLAKERGEGVNSGRLVTTPGYLLRL